MVTRKKPAVGAKAEKKNATRPAARSRATAKATRRPAKKAAATTAEEKAQPPAATESKAAPPPVKEVELLGLQQMASILRLHPLQLRQMAQSGKIPAVVVNGEWRFNKDLVQEALRRRSLGR